MVGGVALFDKLDRLQTEQETEIEASQPNIQG